MFHRFHAAAANSYFYPDVLVTCSALDLASALVKTEPKLIIEVLSPSTDGYRKGADGLWVLHPFARGESVSLASVALELSAAQLFADVLEL